MLSSKSMSMNEREKVKQKLSFHIKCSFQNSAIFEWVLRQISSKGNSLKMKNRILELLSPFLDSSFSANNNRSENVLGSLKKMSELNFPLCSREYAFGSSLYSDYVTTFEKLAQCLEETSSESVLVIFKNLYLKSRVERIQM